MPVQTFAQWCADLAALAGTAELLQPAVLRYCYQYGTTPEELLDKLRDQDGSGELITQINDVIRRIDEMRPPR